MGTVDAESASSDGGSIRPASAASAAKAASVVAGPSDKLSVAVGVDLAGSPCEHFVPGKTDALTS